MGVKSPLRTYFQLLVICICFKKKEMSFHSSFCNLYNISLYMQIFFSLTFLSVLLFIFIFCLSYLVTVFYASMTSGLIYSLITMPLETAKNRMAFQKPDSVTGMYVHDMIRTTVTSYDIMQYRVEYCEVIQCTVIVSSVMWSNTMYNHIQWCDVMWCDVMWYDPVLTNALWWGTRSYHMTSFYQHIILSLYW